MEVYILYRRHLGATFGLCMYSVLKRRPIFASEIVNNYNVHEEYSDPFRGKIHLVVLRVLS